MKYNTKRLETAISKVDCDGFKYFDLSRDLKFNKIVIAHALRNLLLQCDSNNNVSHSKSEIRDTIDKLAERYRYIENIELMKQDIKEKASNGRAK